MKRHLSVAVVIATVVIGAACGTTSSPATPSGAGVPFPHSMKGYELYSWTLDGVWRFTLITGTDASKSVAQITEGPDISTSSWVRVTASSVDSLKEQLRRLRQDESVTWIGRQTREQWGLQAGPLALPPAATIDVVRGYCVQLGLTLRVSP